MTRPLFTLAPTPPKLTERQQLAWDLVQASEHGVWPEEVGAAWAARTGREPFVSSRAEGLSILRSKALRPLVIRRRTGLWEPRRPVARTNAQTSELPDDLFGGE